MKEINFITIGDNNFFPFIHLSIKKLIKFYPLSKIYIYDWGFNHLQRKKLESYYNTIIIDWTAKLNKFNGYKEIIKNYQGYNPPFDYRLKEYLFNQKPICILDCSKRINENLVYLDGDAILINPIDEIFKNDFDIGITTVPKTIIDRENKDYLRILNAGVMFFNLNSKKMQIFIQEWIKKIEIVREFLIEQTSLFYLIKDKNNDIFRKENNVGTIELSKISYKIKNFSCLKYNYYFYWFRYNYPLFKYRYQNKKIKILHFIKSEDYTIFFQIKEYIREIKLRDIILKLLKFFPPRIKYYLEKSYFLNLIAKLIIKYLNFYNIINIISELAKLRNWIKEIP